MNRHLFTPTVLRAWLLAMLLLAAQAAGLAHRVWHAPGAGTAALQTAPIASAWGGLHEQGTPDCRLIDQLAHADVLCSAVAAAAALPQAATAVVAVLLQAPPSRPAAAYQARAPPRA